MILIEKEDNNRMKSFKNNLRQTSLWKNIMMPVIINIRPSSLRKLVTTNKIIQPHLAHYTILIHSLCNYVIHNIGFEL